MIVLDNKQIMNVYVGLKTGEAPPSALRLQKDCGQAQKDKKAHAVRAEGQDDAGA